MNYPERWRLACALKQSYPNLSETGATDESSSSGIVPFLLGTALGAVAGGFLGNIWGETKGFESGKLYAKNRTKWREDMRRQGLDPDAPHMRGIYD
jgi:hypothetical protein